MANVELFDGMNRRSAPARRTQVTDAVTYRIIFSVCFIVFLWSMAVELLAPKQWRTLSDVARGKSLWTSANDAAHRCASIAFQG